MFVCSTFQLWGQSYRLHVCASLIFSQEELSRTSPPKKKEKKRKWIILLPSPEAITAEAIIVEARIAEAEAIKPEVAEALDQRREKWSKKRHAAPMVEVIEAVAAYAAPIANSSLDVGGGCTVG